MTFFERYEKLCLAHGYKPGSEQAAQILGTNRGTISAWKRSGKPPLMEYVVAIADTYGVSVDYLLGRTDDPTDYSNPELLAELAGPQLEEFDGDAKRAVLFQKAKDADAGREATQKGVMLYGQLDAVDKGKAESFMLGLLAHEKYSQPDIGKKKQA